MLGPHPVDGWHISPIFSIRECQVVGYSMNTAYRARGAWPEAEAVGICITDTAQRSFVAAAVRPDAGRRSSEP